MNLFNNSNVSKNSAYNMVGNNNTTYANDNNIDSTEYMPNSYNSQNVVEDERAQIEDIQRKLGLSATTVVEESIDTSEDILPSTSTRNLSFDRQYSATNTSVAMATKTKVAIASYVLVTLILIAAIAICAVSVGSSYTLIASQTATYAETLTELGVLEDVVASFTYEELAASAAALGYSAVDGSNSVGYTVLETRSAQNYSVSSNWFDSVCDWVSGAFGG